MTLARIAVSAVSVLLASAAALAAPPAKVALKGGRIIPVVGNEIAKGTVLIENGKITAVGGEDVQVPFDAMEVDCTGKVIFPGMIDPHSARGLDIPNENIPVTPFLNVYDSVDPSRLFFEDSLRDGVTSVHVMVANECVIGAVSRVVRPIGLSVAEMTVQPDVALKFSTSPKTGSDRMTQMGLMREAFFDLDDATGKTAEKKYEDSLKKDNKKVDVGPAEARKRGMPLLEDSDYEDRYLNLTKARRGDLGCWFYCGAATDVAPAITFATEQKVLDHTVLVLGSEAYKAAAELKKAKRPIVLDPSLFHRERDELTGKLKETFVPGVFHEAGMEFALQPNPSASMAERYLNYQAAVCVRNGIPREEAIKSITITPAKFLGLESRLGSIEVGKTGNVVVFSGDPLDFNSWVEMVYIDGIRAYDRSKDPRLDELLKLEKASAEKKEKAKQEAEEKRKKDEEAKKAEEAKKEEGKKEEGKKEGEKKDEPKKDDAAPDKKEPEKKEEPKPDSPGTGGGL
jgi:imidazolonepropionase-like amidohydrolase